MKIDSIKKYYDHGFNVFPVFADKGPDLRIEGTEKKHLTWQRQWSFNEFPPDAWGVGLACGRWSHNVLVIDVDCKYDLTGTLYDDFMSLLVEVIGVDAVTSMVIEKTMNGGFHLIFFCKKLFGNMKLAFRPPSDAELSENPKAQKKCLIETKGDGGYILIAPTPGYKIINGKLSEIPTFDDDVVEQILQTAGSFDLMPFDETENRPATIRTQIRGKSPWDDYNERGDIVPLLINHGWTIVRNVGQRIHFKHPSATSAVSGNYHEGRRTFYVFSPNTPFPCEKGLSPFKVYTILEHNGDVKMASRTLVEQGYGDKAVNIEQRIKQENVVADNEEIEFNYILPSESEFDKQIRELWIHGWEIGLPFNIPHLDNHLRWKKSSFAMFTGVDNVGKSNLVWYLALVQSVYNKKRWVVYTMENSDVEVFIQLIEYYCGCPIQFIPEIKLNEAIAFIKAHFMFFKSSVEFSIFDLLNQCEHVKKHVYQFDGVIVDPYNALIKIGNEYQHDGRALNAINAFKLRTGSAFWLITHVTTEATRRRDATGNPVKPDRHDVQGGARFPSRSDDFAVVHRLTKDQNRKYITELHIERVRNKRTGGEPTDPDNPILFNMDKNLCQYRVYFGPGNGNASNTWVNILDIVNIPRSEWRTFDEIQATKNKANGIVVELKPSTLPYIDPKTIKPHYTDQSDKFDDLDGEFNDVFDSPVDGDEPF